MTADNALNALAALMLVAAMLPLWRYDYFVILRWVVFMVCLLQAQAAISAQRYAALAIFVLIGILFNPIYPILLKRGLWIWIDFVCAMFMRIGYEDLVFGRKET